MSCSHAKQELTLILHRIALICITSFYFVAAASAGPTVYASGINHTAGGGISSFNPQTGLSSQNVAFNALQVNAQVSADGSKAVYVTYVPLEGDFMVVYSMQSGALLGSIPVAADGNLALSPNSVLAYVNAIEGGVNHVIEVNLDSLALVTDVTYSTNPPGLYSFPIAVSADGGTVFTEDGDTLYALDSATLQTISSASTTLPAGIQVTPDGKYLFGLVEISGSTEAIELVSTSTLAVRNTIDLPAPFKYDFTPNIAISGDGSTVVVLGIIQYYDGAEQQPIGVLDLASRKFTYKLFPDGAYSAAALNKNGSIVYLGDGTGLVSVFNPQTSAVAPAFDAAGAVASLQVGVDGTLYAYYYLTIATVVGVDLSTKQVTRTFALPSGVQPAFTILANAAGTRLYSSGRPTVVDLPQLSVQRFGPVPPATAVYGSLAWNSGQTGIWAAGTQTLDLLDPNTLTVQQSILVGGGDVPLGINSLAITPDQTTAVLTYGKDPQQGSGSGLVVVNLAAGTASGIILDTPEYIALSPDSHYAYITSVRLGPGYPQPYYPVILVFDLTTQKIVQKFSIPVGMNREALSLAISADGTTLYTTAAGEVFAMNSTNGNVIWSVAPGPETIQVATIPGSTDLITCDLTSTNLSRLSSTGQVIDVIDVGIPTAYLTVLSN